MKNLTIKDNNSFTIQIHIAIILFLLSFLTAVLNFVNGLINYGYTLGRAFTHIAILPTLIVSLILLITAFRDSEVLRYIQVIVVLLAGYTTVILTIPGTLTGTLFILLSLVLAYQYGFFATFFWVKIGTILGIYVLATFINVLIIHNSKLPLGIPSILFSLTSIYLFWVVFRVEINSYLVHTNQLNRKLEQVVSENKQLGHITYDQAVLIKEKNRTLEAALKEKTAIEEELRRTLKVKDLLLQEVHHRVKNNLSIINGLFNLQRSDNNSDIVNSFIDTNSNRLYAMAAVHEAVYQSEAYESVDLNHYFSDIIQNLIQIYSENKELEIDISGENIEVTIDIAVSLGIILSDCVSNSITYGFSDNGQNKKISINLKKAEKIEITITDNGIYIPMDVHSSGEDSSFSLWLIKLLVEDQLKGSIITNYKHGNIWKIQFPK